MVIFSVFLWIELVSWVLDVYFIRILMDGLSWLKVVRICGKRWLV